MLYETGVSEIEASEMIDARFKMNRIESIVRIHLLASFFLTTRPLLLLHDYPTSHAELSE